MVSKSSCVSISLFPLMKGGKGMKHKKPIAFLFSAFLIVCLITGMLTMSAAEMFSDVTPDHPYVTALKNAGVVVGYGGRFNGEDLVTRAGLAVFIAKTLGLTDGRDLSFTDVDNNAWYSNYVKLAVGGKYMEAEDNKMFLPDKQITCEDLFLLIEEEVKADNTFRPDPKAIAPLIADFSKPVTRYQAAHVMYELYVHKQKPKTMPEKMVVGYYGNWQVYSLLKPAEIPWNMITNLNHGFLTVSDGTPSDETFDWAPAPKYSLAFTDSWSDIWMDAGAGDGGIFKVYERMHRIYPNVTIMASVGGWTRGQMFSEMAKTAETREIFIKSCLEIMKRNPWLGGIDLDWEYPGVYRNPATDGLDDPVDFGSGVGGHDVKIDKGNFTALLKEMRSAMDAAGYKEKKLTICEAADYEQTATAQNLDEVAKYVNFINVMCYDMSGPYDDKTSHHAAVYDNAYTTFSVDQAITGYLKHFKPEQLNVGVATYSRGWANVVPDAKGELRGRPAGTENSAPDTAHPDADPNSRYYRGDGDAATGQYEVGEGWSAGKHKATDMPEVLGKWYGLNPSACFRLETIKKMLKDTDRYTYYYDETAEAPYLYDSKDKVYLSFEDERSTQAKVDYVWKHDLGGLIYWETATDIKSEGFPITRIMYEGVCK